MNRIWKDWRTSLVGIVGAASSLLSTTWGQGLPLTLENGWPILISLFAGFIGKDSRTPVL